MKVRHYIISKHIYHELKALYLKLQVPETCHWISCCK